MFFAPLKSSYTAIIGIMDVSKTNDHIKIKNKMPNPSQEPPASSKAPNEDLKDMSVLCTYKIMIKSQNSEHGCIKVQVIYRNQDLFTNIRQEPPVSSLTPARIIHCPPNPI